MTTSAMPAGEQDSFAQLKAKVEYLEGALKALIGGTPLACARTPTRDETPSGYKNKDFDRDEWIKLETSRLEAHPRCEILVLVIRMMRPELTPDDVRKVFRDWVRWNIKRMEKKGKTAKSRRLRDLIGFAVKWIDKLEESRKRNAAVFAGLGRVAMAAIKKPVKSVKAEKETQTDMSEHDQELTRLAAKASHSTWKAQLMRLRREIGGDKVEERITAWIERCGCSRERAAMAVVGHAESSGVLD
ncbi:hypothetical protein ATO8_19339 [Roseivivax marinus]|uniref:Uncharacterized protein n=1 Tax=Roseivivax marinus TaxID=1379903 RepID=W4HE12_9RHOB|nr:hypothetical protein [Roseivivax marinus]ETW11007.1 hypothetical protein ATO8_19339 [Roseivivax marinus]